MENKELLEKLKSIVEGTDVKEIYGYYSRVSDEGGFVNWDFVTNNSCPESNFIFSKIKDEIYELFDIALEKFLGDAWSDGHAVAGTISYNAPNKKNPNGVLTLNIGSGIVLTLPDEYIK